MQYTCIFLQFLLYKLGLWRCLDESGSDLFLLEKLTATKSLFTVSQQLWGYFE